MSTMHHGSHSEPTRPATNITADDISPGMTFVTYIPGEHGSAQHGRFLSFPEWVDDETVRQVLVEIEGMQRTMELHSLGIGNSRYGEPPKRACIMEDAE